MRDIQVFMFYMVFNPNCALIVMMPFHQMWLECGRFAPFQKLLYYHGNFDISLSII